MKIRIAAVAVAMMLATPAWAGTDPVAELAEASGLSERKVGMILGTRTAYAEYRYTYSRALKQFQTAIGEENHLRLMAGESIRLPYRGQIRVVSLSPSGHPRAL
ncbi:MAG: hypothetical protein M3Q40_05020 [Pseudomonadota bacterium]|nr:hypothetical protein [Pseudomonadota bacterium]